MKVFWHILKRDAALGINAKSGLLQLLSFFLVIATLFPLSIGPNEEVLSNIASGVILVIVMLLSALSLPVYFENDYDDGTLEQYFLLLSIPGAIVLAKVVSNWLTNSLPLIVVSPLIALGFGMESEEINFLVISLIIATPTISLIGCLSASLALGTSTGSILYSILALPLYMPVLIFASGRGIVTASDFSAILGLLAIFLIMLPISLFLSSYALKLRLSS